MSQNVNSVIVSGRLTRDPELRSTPSGTSVCHLSIAVNDRVKNAQSGEYEDRANFFDVDCFGARADANAKYLEKGQAVAVQGRLRWRSWETPEGQKRSAVSIVADIVEWGAKAGQGGGSKPADAFEQAKDIAKDAQGSDDDPYADGDSIPF
jgi:single-strand DNA-binding protein